MSARPKSESLKKQLEEAAASFKAVQLEYEAEKRKERELARAKERDQIVQFRAKLEDDCGIQHTHPKADLLFSIAWNRGHSAGMQEVEGIYYELVELIK